MKRILLSLLSLSLWAGSLHAMELPPQAPAQSQQEKLVTIIAADGSTHTMPKEQAEASETIKYLISETGSDQEIPLAHVANSTHFNMLAPFFKLAYEIAQSKKLNDLEKLAKKQEELILALERLSLKDLHTIIRSCNYLDLQDILNAAIEILAAKLSDKERVLQCLKKGYYELEPQDEKGNQSRLQLDLNTAYIIAQKMLQKSAAKPWFLQKKVKDPERPETNGYGARAFDSHNSLFACHLGTNQITLRNKNGQIVENLIIENPLEGAENHLNSTARFSANGARLAFYFYQYEGETRITVWDMPSKKELITISDSPSPYVKAYYKNIMALSPDGKLLAYCTVNRTIKLINIDTSQIVYEAPRSQVLAQEKVALCFDPTNTYLAIARTVDVDPTVIDIEIHDIKKCVEGLPSLINRIRDTGSTGYYDMCFSSDGTLIAFANGKKIQAYTIKTKQLVFSKKISRLTLYNTNYTNICFNKDSSIIAAFEAYDFHSRATQDKIHMWDLKTGQPIGNPFTINSWVVVFNIFTIQNDMELVTNSPRDGFKIYNLANLADKQALETEVKIPEQAALLLGIYDFAQSNAVCTAEKYPGANNIPLTQCLYEAGAFINTSWRNWLMQYVPSSLVTLPVAALLAHGAYKSLKK